jgi:hypothetical protein
VVTQTKKGECCIFDLGQVRRKTDLRMQQFRLVYIHA